ncbi:pantothenate kinase [Candidatus Termititenax persephonae]|uniref:Type III pantothenate kinase n=1 Tax=Candidatus Termititenax persephonae TaxID=2218525 RepID=A0A388THD6_9BACT|nr:pantothenate kinase [Candidatus Termititenax persephonae]
MKLCLDVGNTSISLGFFADGRLLQKSSLPTADYRKFRLPPQIDKVVYASVVPHIDPYFAHRCSPTNFLPLTYKHIKNIRIALPQKKEIGIDRLVNASGAAVFYGSPLIIIDLGTATTFCVLDQKLVYQGGLICPGINLTRLVLHEKTAKLPLIELKSKPPRLIGNSTVKAMRSGIYYGYAALINGLAAALRQEVPRAKVIATGGYAELLAQDIDTDIIDTDLTLKSLNLF